MASMIDFENESYLYLLGIIPVLIFLYVKYRSKQAKANLKLGDNELVNKLIGGLPAYKYILKFLLLSLALISLVISLTNPELPGKKQTDTGLAKTDIVFAVDVSKSMLARDVVPSRLARAQSFILSVINHLNGERVAVVIFAGKADTYVPLTLDYNFAKSAVKTISNNLIVKQGTAIKDAVKISSSVLNNKNNDLRIACILSDGETPDVNFEATADSIKRASINLFAFGLGTPTGANIIEQNQDGIDIIKKDKNGSPILSRLHEESLLKLVKYRPDRYIRLTDKDLVTATFIKELRSLERNTKSVVLIRTEYFQLFLVIALFLLLIEILFP